MKQSLIFHYSFWESTHECPPTVIIAVLTWLGKPGWSLGNFSTLYWVMLSNFQIIFTCIISWGQYRNPMRFIQQVLLLFLHYRWRAWDSNLTHDWLRAGMRTTHTICLTAWCSLHHSAVFPADSAQRSNATWTGMYNCPVHSTLLTSCSWNFGKRHILNVVKWRKGIDKGCSKISRKENLHILLWCVMFI